MPGDIYRWYNILTLCKRLDPNAKGAQAKLFAVFFVGSLSQLASVAVHPDDNKSEDSLEDSANCDTQEIEVPRMPFLNLTKIEIDVGVSRTTWTKRG